MCPVPYTMPKPAQRWGIARWKRGTPAKHGALVALDIVLAILTVLTAALIWLNDFGWWLSIPGTIAALGAVAEAVHEVHLLRSGRPDRA
jgi:uncharacterized membrane protein